MDPWSVGPQPVYSPSSGRAVAESPPSFSLPETLSSSRDFGRERARLLRGWGAKREAEIQRPPDWCMDQLVSGSGLYPPRLLDETWFSQEELGMISSLEALLAPTGNAHVLARDMMALRIYNVDVRIICDDSGSMDRGMLSSAGGQSGGWTGAQVKQVFGKRAFTPDTLGTFASCPFGPGVKRWTLLRDALQKWEKVFEIMDVRRKLYLLNGEADPATKDLQQFLAGGPRGGTPMGKAFLHVLHQFRNERLNRPLLVLALTDGEANDKDLFNKVLDQIQDGKYGDVQVCLLGLSLEPDDIEWFEDEECDDTRIRTIEPFEVEQQQILWRKVIQRSDDYNFEMHTFRALVTNFFPADYDYEAPVQTLRHRLYITLHAFDRRFTGRRDNTYPRRYFDTECRLFRCLCRFLQRGGAREPLLRADDDALDVEAFSSEDDGVLGSFFESLKVLSLPQRDSSTTSLSENGRRRSSTFKPHLEPKVLEFLQHSISILQPSEQQMRDLQYSDVAQNRRIVSKALVPLRKAAQLLGRAS